MKGTFIYEGVSFDMAEMSKWSEIEKTKNFLPIEIGISFKKSLNFTQNNYQNKDKYKIATDFIEINIPEVLSFSEIHFGGILYEIEMTLNHSISLSHCAFYKEAIFNLRSVLELTLQMARFYTQMADAKLENDFKYKEKEDFFKVLELYFKHKYNIEESTDSEYYKIYEHDINILKRYDEEKSNIYAQTQEWLGSKSKTPHKGNFKNKFYKGSFGGYLKSNPMFNSLINETTWVDDFDMLWDKLNNYVHSNGLKYMNIILHNDNPSPAYIPRYNEKSFELFLENFIATTQQIAIISATMKPELLDEEFAYQIELQTNEPLIGTGLWGGATSIFFDLIPKGYRKYFMKYRRQCEN